MANVTKPIALDETLQAVNETLGEIKEAILPSNTYIPKVASPTAGNLASLKADGTIEDSGLAKTDVAHLSTEALDIKMLGWSVPKECPIQNYMDSNRVFHQKVGRVDLGSLASGYVPSPTPARLVALISGAKNPPNDDTAANLFCAKYTNIARNNMVDKTISIASNKYVNIADSSYNNESAFKAAMQGVYLYYELATEIVTDIDGHEATLPQGVDDASGLTLTSSYGTISNVHCVRVGSLVNVTFTMSTTSSIPSGSYFVNGLPAPIMNDIGISVYSIQDNAFPNILIELINGYGALYTPGNIASGRSLRVNAVYTMK